MGGGIDCTAATRDPPLKIMAKLSKNAHKLLLALELAHVACAAQDLAIINIDHTLKRARKAVKRFIKHG